VRSKNKRGASGAIPNKVLPSRREGAGYKGKNAENRKHGTAGGKGHAVGRGPQKNVFCFLRNGGKSSKSFRKTGPQQTIADSKTPSHSCRGKRRAVVACGESSRKKRGVQAAWNIAFALGQSLLKPQSPWVGLQKEKGQAMGKQ